MVDFVLVLELVVSLFVIVRLLLQQAKVLALSVLSRDCNLYSDNEAVKESNIEIGASVDILNFCAEQ